MELPHATQTNCDPWSQHRRLGMPWPAVATHPAMDRPKSPEQAEFQVWLHPKRVNQLLLLKERRQDRNVALGLFNYPDRYLCFPAPDTAPHRLQTSREALSCLETDANRITSWLKHFLIVVGNFSVLESKLTSLCWRELHLETLNKIFE